MAADLAWARGGRFRGIVRLYDSFRCGGVGRVCRYVGRAKGVSWSSVCVKLRCVERAFCQSYLSLGALFCVRGLLCPLV